MERKLQSSSGSPILTNLNPVHSTKEVLPSVPDELCLLIDQYDQKRWKPMDCGIRHFLHTAQQNADIQPPLCFSGMVPNLLNSLDHFKDTIFLEIQEAMLELMTPTQMTVWNQTKTLLHEYFRNHFCSEHELDHSPDCNNHTCVFFLQSITNPLNYLLWAGGEDHDSVPVIFLPEFALKLNEIAKPACPEWIRENYNRLHKLEISALKSMDFQIRNLRKNR